MKVFHITPLSTNIFVSYASGDEKLDVLECVRLTLSSCTVLLLSAHMKHSEEREAKTIGFLIPKKPEWLTSC